MAGKSIRIEAKEVKANLEQIEQRARAGIYATMEAHAKQMETYAKRNRPWTDRTTHARQRLRGYVEKKDNFVRVGIAHGVDYGKSLELEHEKRYAILKPTLDNFASKIMNDFKLFMKKVRI